MPIARTCALANSLSMAYDAVLRNLAVVGEALRALPRQDA